MPRYDVDGVQYEIDDGVDIFAAVDAIRKDPGHQEAMQRLKGPSVGGFLKENAPFMHEPEQTPDEAIETYNEMPLSQKIPQLGVGALETVAAGPTFLFGKFAQGAGSIAGGLMGDTPEEARQRGERWGENTTYQPRSTGGQAILGLMSKGFEEGIEGVGMASGGAGGAQAQARASLNPNQFANPTQQQLDEGFNEEARALGKGVAEFALFAGPTRGVGKSLEHRLIERRANTELAKKKLAEQEAESKQAAASKEFQEKAVQRDWITEQQAQEMGPQREPSPPPRGPQRDFWEQEPPVDTGLEPRTRGETAPLDFSREPGTGIYKAEPSPGRPQMVPDVTEPREAPLPPYSVDPSLRRAQEAVGRPSVEVEQGPPRHPQGGIPYERDFTGVTRVLERTAEENQARIKADMESTVRRAQEDAAYSQRAGEQLRDAQQASREAARLPTLERLEADLRGGDMPRVGPTNTPPLGGVGKRGFGQGGAVDFGEIVRLFPKFRDTTLKTPVYHGTDTPANALKPGAFSGIWGRGIYLTSEPSTASRFANLAGWRRGETAGGGENVRQVYVNLKNPLRMEDTAAIRNLENKYPRESWESRLQKEGYDGAIGKLSDGVQVMVLSPDQIVSATSPVNRLGKGSFKQGGAAIDVTGVGQKIRSKLEDRRARKADEAKAFDEFRRELEHTLGYRLPTPVAKKFFQKSLEPSPVSKSSSPLPPERQVLRDISDKLSESTRELYYNQRDVPEMGEWLKQWKASGGEDLSAFGKGSNVLPTNYSAQKHPMFRWIASKIAEIKDKYTKEAEGVLIGNEIVNGTRVKAKDSPQALWEGLKKNEKIAINDLGNKLTDQNLPATPENIRNVLGRDMNPAEQRAFEAIGRVGKWVLSSLNQMREAKGLPRLPGREFYWTPAMWKGDYLYFLKDPKTGEIAHVFGTHYRPNSYMGRMFNRELNKALKQYGLKIKPEDFKRMTSPDEFSMSSLEVLLERQGRRLSEEAQAVRDAAEKAITEFEFSRARGHERKGRPGYMGSEGGYRGVKNFEKVLDRMVMATANLKTNLELTKLYREITKSEGFGAFPNAKIGVLDRLDNAMGHTKQLFSALDNTIANWLDVAGLPPSAVSTLTTAMGNASTRLLLGLFLPVQLIVQIPQSLYSIPKAQQLTGRAGKGVVMTQYIVTKAIAKTVADMMTRPDYFNRLAAEGTYTPTMRMEYGGFGSQHQWRRADIHALAWWESNVVRKPAAAIFYNTLKELGFEGKELSRTVRGLTDDYMVSFDRHKKAPWIANTGTFGDLVGRLQSFPLTWMAQFLEYSKGTLTKGELAPLATFMGINAALSGLLGLFPIRDADAFIELLNQVMGWDAPTASEVIMTETKSDTLRYGAVSAILGMNVGASMASPTVSGTMLAPGAQLMISIAKLAGLGWDMAKEEETSTIPAERKRDVAKGLVPRGLHGAVEYAYQNGKFVTNRKGAGIIERGPKDWAARGLGTFSVEESEKKRIEQMGIRREQRLSKKRASFIDSFIQHFMDGGEWNEKWTQKAMELGYTGPKDISGPIKNRIVEMNTTAKERMLKGVSTAKQARMYELWNRLEGQR